MRYNTKESNTQKNTTIGLVSNLNIQYHKEQQTLAREEKRLVKNYFNNLLIGKEAEERIRLLSTRSKTLKR